jgi:hypothetical protein
MPFNTNHSLNIVGKGINDNAPLKRDRLPKGCINITQFKTSDKVNQFNCLKEISKHNDAEYNLLFSKLIKIIDVSLINTTTNGITNGSWLIDSILEGKVEHAHSKLKVFFDKLTMSQFNLERIAMASGATVLKNEEPIDRHPSEGLIIVSPTHIETAIKKKSEFQTIELLLKYALDGGGPWDEAVQSSIYEAVNMTYPADTLHRVHLQNLLESVGMSSPVSRSSSAYSQAPTIVQS